ncbi:MAG: YbaK/EbsC family protein [Anaerolineae bacterium]|nr:YbaK/EbsC family protein [Anaerolineae bacterium]
MRYQTLSIQTQREAPNNARTQVFAFLVRGGYLTRDNQPTKLGKHTLAHLENLAADLGDSLFSKSSIPVIGDKKDTFFSLDTETHELIHCPTCGYTARSEAALFAKDPSSKEEPLPIEKVATPECSTIEELANFLNISKEKTAKAPLYTRQSDGKLLFAVIRSDMQISEAKLQAQVGELKPAVLDEIEAAGAVPGYAAPIDLIDVFIIVDDLITDSPNLVAGANEFGYHLKNVNYGRDYTADIAADLVQAAVGSACLFCGNSLSTTSADLLDSKEGYHFDKILHALAETHHDENGLTIPHPATPFGVYLMQITGKESDTKTVAAELYESLINASISVLFDDRDTRAGVKFKDADLIGCSVRVVVGERGLINEMVELKARTAKDKNLVPLDKSVEEIQNLLMVL